MTEITREEEGLVEKVHRIMGQEVFPPSPEDDKKRISIHPAPQSKSQSYAESIEQIAEHRTTLSEKKKKHLLEFKRRMEADPGFLARNVEERITEYFPELLAKFYPRVYEDVGPYFSPRMCASYLANMIVECAQLGVRRCPSAYQIMLPGMEQMARKGMPSFFIAPDLLQAIMRTDFDGDIDWTTLKLPYEQGMFILPCGAFRHAEDGEIAMIFWGRYRPGIYPPPVTSSVEFPPVEITQEAFILVALCPQRGVWYDSIMTTQYRPTVKLRNLFYVAPGEAPVAHNKATLDADLTPKDHDFLEQVGVIALGTLLAMNARPELVERGRLLKKVKKAERVKEFWSPNIIGRKYHFVNEDGEKGTHASPKMHWRRGHFRNQAYGVEYKEHKTIWLEPMLVNAKGEEK